MRRMKKDVAKDLPDKIQRVALCTLSPDQQMVYRQYQREDVLPWDLIDHGYRNDFLWKDYQRGLAELHTPVCDTATCKICGVC